MAKSLRAKPILDRADNLLTNGHLRPGRKTSGDWDVCFHDSPITVLRPSPAGTRIGPTGQGHVDLSQSIRAYPNRRYRLDIHAEPLRPPTGRTFAGCLQARFASFQKDELIRAHEPPAMHIGADAPRIHRAYFQCPPGTGRLQVRLRFRTDQPIRVKRIRLVETGHYLLVSHALANPPTPTREPPPGQTHGALLCDGRKDNRPLLRWLQALFGTRQVRRITPKQLPPAIERLGTNRNRPALIVDLPETRATAPSLDDLHRWSDRLIVIASLATFAGSASRAGLRDIRLQDRMSGLAMPCGEIVLSGYYTRGFALADAIPYAWNDRQDDFAHRFLVMPKQARARLAAEWNIRPSLVTECGRREIDNHPLTLYRPGKHGALLVMDPDGLEAPSAGEDIPRIFDLLWRAALGQETLQFGQFAAPPTHYEGMMVDLVELSKHYNLIEDLSILRRVHGQGNSPPTWQLPSRRADRFAHRPTLRIRTGFAESDWPAVYGLILWLKRLALAATQSDPRACALLKRMRVLACPLARPQHWRGCPKDLRPTPCDLPPRNLLGSIDLRIGQERQTVVLVPDRSGESLVRRHLGKDVQVRVSPAAFQDDTPPGSGKRLHCKVLLPAIPQPSPANSPQLTDLAATLLESLALAIAGPASR